MKATRQNVASRHGEMMEIKHVVIDEMQDYTVIERAKAFPGSGYNSMAIICKTQQQAGTVFNRLRDEADCHLIDADSKVFSGGALIATAYLAKGLEFDQTVVPFCSEREYSSAIDRHMLYVAVTRAMHTLTISHTGPITPFLRGAASPQDSAEANP